MIVTGCLLLGWSGWSRAAQPVVLDVRTEPTGGVRATATILFPVEPAIIQRLLTDYAHWPDLFDVRMRMAEIREQDGKAFTDIRIDHVLLSPQALDRLGRAGIDKEVRGASEKPSDHVPVWVELRV